MNPSRRPPAATRPRPLLALVLLGAVAVAGCPEPGYGVEIRFDGTVTASADGFEMDGTVAVGGAAKLDAYRNVAVALYAENGTALHTGRAGTLEGRLPVSVAVPFVSHYVVIDLQDFWREPRAAVHYFRRVEASDDYDRETARSRDELPPDGRSNRRPKLLPAPPMTQR